MPATERKLSPEAYDFDYSGLRKGYYSDAYFGNGARVLEALARDQATYSGSYARANVGRLDLSTVVNGDIEVEMQFFAKVKPYCIAAGVDAAITILRECTGYFEGKKFHNTADRLEIDAVPEGTKLQPRTPAMKVRGRYRDFAIQETTTLGVMARASLIATNTHRVLEAARGKPILFFPARFDTHKTQQIDGYAYKLAVDVYNRDHNADMRPLISTDAQGQWWGGKGTGTVAHAYILSFFADCPEAMLAFAKYLPPGVNRIALVDTNDDCVNDSARTAMALFRRHMELKERGDADEAELFRLYGVRADNPNDVRDASVEPLGDPALDCGPCPRLISKMREKLDYLHESPDIPEHWRTQAREYFQSVKIVASGGFTSDKVELYEKIGVPVDAYGIGSFFLKGANDYTADVVRVKLDETWYDLAKVGRAPWHNPELERVQ